MSRGFPLQDTGPGMSELFHDLQAEESMLRQDTIERVSKTLTRAQIDGMRRVRKHGPAGWAFGQGRAGGAIRRMFDRLNEAGIVAGPPYELTPFGAQVLSHLDD